MNEKITDNHHHGALVATPAARAGTSVRVLTPVSLDPRACSCQRQRYRPSAAPRSGSAANLRAQRACGARSASAGRCGCGGARTSRGCYGRDAGPHASQEGVRVQRQPPVALATALIRIVPLPQPNAWWCTRSLNGRRCAPNISCCSLSLVNNEHITARA